MWRTRSYLPARSASSIQRGFTLIELLIVFTLIVLLTSMGFVGMRQYTDRQLLSETTSNFVSALKLARSRAQTQVKPTATYPCTTRPLSGYKIKLLCTASTCSGFQTIPVCGGIDYPVTARESFPSPIYATASSQELLFQTITGRVTGIQSQGIIDFHLGESEKRSVRIFSDGRIETVEN